MKYLYPKVIDTKVNIDNRGYLIETYKKKEINTDFKYSILVSSKKLESSLGSHSLNATMIAKSLLLLNNGKGVPGSTGPFVSPGLATILQYQSKGGLSRQGEGFHRQDEGQGRRRDQEAARASRGYGREEHEGRPQDVVGPAGQHPELWMWWS